MSTIQHTDAKSMHTVTGRIDRATRLSTQAVLTYRVATWHTERRPQDNPVPQKIDA